MREDGSLPLTFHFTCQGDVEEEVKPRTCTTVGGPAKGSPCVFPFTFNWVTWTSCIDGTGGQPDGTLWCSTKVDESGVHVSGGGHYGFCGVDCNSPIEKSYKSSKLLLKHGVVNKPLKEVCPKGRIQIAFINGAGFVLVRQLSIPWREENSYIMHDTGMHGIQSSLIRGGKAFTNQILSSFFTFYNLTPTWQSLNRVSRTC